MSSGLRAREWQAAIAACSVYGTDGAARRIRALQRGEPAADQHPVPARAVLVEQQDRRAVGPDARASARRLQLHQRRQAVHLRLARQQRGQHATEPQRLLEQLRAQPVVAGGGGVALVEDQVDRLQHRGEPLGQLAALGHLERHPRGGERALGAHDALLHGRLGHEVGAGDLLGGEPRQQAEGQRHARLDREHRVAGDEDQAQHVVVERVGGLSGEVGRVRPAAQLQVAPELLGLAPVHFGAAQAVDRPVLGRRHQPGAGVVGDPGRGHCSSAATSASCARSSARPTSRTKRARPAIRRADSIRHTASIVRVTSAAGT